MMTMKLIKKIAAFTLLLIIIFVGNSSAAGNKDRELVILFTHDLHSYFLPHHILTEEGNQMQQGGYAKLTYLIKEQRLLHQNKTLLVDAGDFSMGTPVSYTHLRAHETVLDLVCRLLLEKKK